MYYLMAIRTLKPWLEKSELVATTGVVSPLLLQWICLSNSATKILSRCIFRSSVVQARAVTYVHILWLLKANSGQSIVFVLSDVVSGLNKCLLLEGMQNYGSYHGYISILQQATILAN